MQCMFVCDCRQDQTVPEAVQGESRAVPAGEVLQRRWQSRQILDSVCVKTLLKQDHVLSWLKYRSSEPICRSSSAEV